ncbi:MAG: Holliday junction helicase RuvA [Clostridia bacterium]|nr:Holliday junction helicase RuvA [Clostridia bacterium]
MYYYLNGTLSFIDTHIAVIDCGGVGYKCHITLNTYKNISKKEKVKLFTYLNVKEDALDLYGFENEQEQQFFILLLSISGIGPKVALSVLSELIPEEFAACVLNSDYKSLTKASGVGAKVAQRICLELKDKMTKISNSFDEKELSIESSDVGTDTVSESTSVLMALGYNKNDARQAVLKCSAENTNDRVKQALRLLSKHL